MEDASSPALDAARHFLKTVWDGTPPTDQAMLRSIDRLLAEFHNVPKSNFNDTEANPPDQHWRDLYALVAKRFPDYGYYTVADPLELSGSTSMMVADAVDDIADMTKDMREIIWYAENGDVDEAHWWFRQYYNHWGAHARNLASYLFARTQ